MSYKKVLQMIISVLLILLMTVGCAQPAQENATTDVPYTNLQDPQKSEQEKTSEKQSLIETDSEVKTQKNELVGEQPLENTNNIPKKETSDVQQENVPVSSEDSATRAPSPSTAETSDDPVKERYNSLQELLSTAGVATGENLSNSVQNANTQTDLAKYYAYFYVPATIPEGYTLYRITVSEYNIQYRYKLIADPDNDKMNITATFDNPNQFINKKPMQAAVDQVGLSLTEDGYLYNPKYGDIAFPVGDSRMSIRVPESMNTYEQLKPLCVATRYEVNQNDNTVTE